MPRPTPYERINLKPLPTALIAALLFIFSNTAFSQVVIQSITPNAARVGATITITGSGFNTNPSYNTVYIGAARATVTAASATALTVTVPRGATYGRIMVVNWSTAHSPQNFTVIEGGPLDANSFSERKLFASGDSPDMIASTDLDADGKPDIIVSNFYASTITIYKNTSTPGNVSFFASDWHTEVEPEAIAVDDVNADGKPDLLITSISNHSFVTLINNCTPNSLAWAGSPVTLVGFNAWPRGIATADLDGDGLPDVVTADNNKIYEASGSYYGTISVMRNTSAPPNLSYDLAKTFRVWSYARSVKLADLDGDKKPDAVVANHIDKNVSVLRNTTNGSNIDFVTQQTLQLNNVAQQVQIGDIDGDGKKDVLVSDQYSVVAVYRNTSTNGNISFAPVINIPVQGVLGFSLGDLDGDGKPDLATPNFFTKSIAVLRNTSTPGSISFAAKIEYALDGIPIDAHIGDIDLDGLPDLTITLGENDQVEVLRLKAPIYTLNIGNDTSFCEGPSKQITANIPNAQYAWSTGATTQSITVSQSGKYWVDVTAASGVYSDTIEITVKPFPRVNFGSDTTICEGSSITLDATHPGATYYWSNGATTPTITVSQPGKYTGVVTLDGCSDGDSIKIFTTKAPSFILGPDGILCNNQSVNIEVHYPGATYQWQDGSTDSVYTISRAGRYEITVTNACGSTTDDIQFTAVDNCELNMPNAFTPNNDNNNDVFRVKYPQFIAAFDMKIYNRWGEIIYQSTDARKGWDGSYKGILQPEGNFVWTITLVDIMGRKKSYKGLVLLIR
jgi:gliding motility-associated-like protein